ncbi:hypothetical protein [uncultured Cardiobacterium sp.]|uniref:hypothetical protein n=1 Tax=uncultured Cardiobacterium sp. TaxID=417619 RepID=UPI0026381C0B|nr:hypothetical protein [uncultured Cardiobacterium sp.]
MIVIALYYAALFYHLFGYHAFCLVSGRLPEPLEYWGIPTLTCFLAAGILLYIPLAKSLVRLSSAARIILAIIIAMPIIRIYTEPLFDYYLESQKPDDFASVESIMRSVSHPLGKLNIWLEGISNLCGMFIVPTCLIYPIYSAFILIRKKIRIY